MTASSSRRGIIRLMVMVLTIFGIGAWSLVAAQTASAARCATDAHVYVNGSHVKYESDPLDGPIDTVYVTYNGTITFGGNGITPNEYPFWNIHRESDGQYIATDLGNKAGDNCVSNEISYRANLTRGSYILYAFYYSGNHGTVISAQKHIREVVY